MGIAAAISKRETCNISDCSYLRKWGICMNVIIFSFSREKRKITGWEENDWYLPAVCVHGSDPRLCILLCF